MAEDTIRVKAGPKVEPGRVAVWDRDPAHPDGEVYLAKAHEGEEDQEIEVAETAGVIMALGEGRLVRADHRRGRKAADDGEEPAEESAPNRASGRRAVERPEG